MADPVVELLVGPNGAGKSTFFYAVIRPVTEMRFVNAYAIAADHWPDQAEERSYDAARLAEEERTALIADRVSFATETVFSHESKLDLIRVARDAGYIVNVRVVLVSEDTAVARVAQRVAHGDGTGHAVSEEKIRSRYRRLWALVSEAIDLATSVRVYDNSSPDEPFRRIAVFRDGRLLEHRALPAWAPRELAAAIKHRSR